MPQGVKAAAKNSLTDEQRMQIRDAVLDLANSKRFDEWTIDDVAERVKLASWDVSTGYSSKEHLLLEAVLSLADAAMDEMAEGPGASKVGGRTPRSRILRTVQIFTDLVLESPTRGRALVQALAAGQVAAVPMVRARAERMRMAIARALAGGEPGDPEWAAAGVIQQVWLSAVVSWASGIAEAEHIEESVVRALRVLKVNQ
jgi:AcrR family transcriptional regulator